AAPMWRNIPAHIPYADMALPPDGHHEHDRQQQDHHGDEEAAEGAEAGHVVIDAADLGLQLVELLAQARRLDVEALHLVAELVDLALPRGVGLLELVHQIGHGVDAAPDVPD